jgi:hypothetical protein
MFFSKNEFTNKSHNIEYFLYMVIKKIIFFNEERKLIVLLAMKILEKYIDLDTTTFFYEHELTRYFEIVSVTCLWISYKFIIDRDDISSFYLQKITYYNYINFVRFEREILQFINYDIYKISKEINYE